MDPELMKYFMKPPGEIIGQHGPSQDELMQEVAKAKNVSSFVRDLTSYFNKPGSEATQQNDLVSQDNGQDRSTATGVVKQKPLPYDSLFDYKEEEKRVTNRLERQRQFEQKVAKTNALGEALKVLVESAGAIGGATINQREPNSIGLKALDNMRALDAEERANLEKLRALKLNTAVQNLSYQLGLEKEQRDRKFATDQQQAEWNFRADESAAEREARKQAAIADNKARIDQENARTQGQIAIDNNRVAKGMYDYRNQELRKTITLNGVSVSPGMQTAMIRALQVKYADDPLPPNVLRAVSQNETVRDESLQDLFLSEWDYLQQAIPELGKVNPVKPTGGIQAQGNAQPNVSSPEELKGRKKRAYNRIGTDVASLSPEDYLSAIENAASNLKEPYRKRMQAIVDIALNRNPDWDVEKARRYAKSILELDNYN